MQERMVMLLDRSVIGATDDINSRQMALSQFGKQNAYTQDLRDALEKYKTCKRASEYCTARDNYLEVGGEEGAFMKMTAERATGQHYDWEPFYEDLYPE